MPGQNIILAMRSQSSPLAISDPLPLLAVTLSIIRPSCHAVPPYRHKFTAPWAVMKPYQFILRAVVKHQRQAVRVACYQRTIYFAPSPYLSSIVSSSQRSTPHHTTPQHLPANPYHVFPSALHVSQPIPIPSTSILAFCHSALPGATAPPTTPTTREQNYSTKGNSVLTRLPT